MNYWKALNSSADWFYVGPLLFSMVVQQHPHHLGVYQKGPISSPTPFLTDSEFAFLARLSMDAQWTEKCWGGRTEGILRAHFKCFTHMNSGGYIHPACPLPSKLPWDVLTQEMALVIRCELTQSKKLAWATKAILPFSFLAALQKWAWGFCKGPQNDLTTPGLSLPYSRDLPVGVSMCLGTSNILPIKVPGTVTFAFRKPIKGKLQLHPKERNSSYVKNGPNPSARGCSLCPERGD